MGLRTALLVALAAAGGVALEPLPNSSSHLLDALRPKAEASPAAKRPATPAQKTAQAKPSRPETYSEPHETTTNEKATTWPAKRAQAAKATAAAGNVPKSETAVPAKESVAWPNVGPGGGGLSWKPVVETRPLVKAGQQIGTEPGKIRAFGDVATTPNHEIEPANVTALHIQKLWTKDTNENPAAADPNRMIVGKNWLPQASLAAAGVLLKRSARPPAPAWAGRPWGNASRATHEAAAEEDKDAKIARMEREIAKLKEEKQRDADEAHSTRNASQAPMVVRVAVKKPQAAPTRINTTEAVAKLKHLTSEAMKPTPKPQATREELWEFLKGHAAFERISKEAEAEKSLPVPKAPKPSPKPLLAGL